MKPLPPNDLGIPLAVETCQKIKIDDLLKQYRDGYKEAMLSSQLKIMGVAVDLATSRTKFQGVRFWFKCPSCTRRAGVLFKHPVSNALGCRICLNICYRKQRYKGMIEGQ